jgi:hypothetical protein
LVAEEMTLQELRQARKLTQVRWPRFSASGRMAFPVGKSGSDLAFHTKEERRGDGWQLVLSC